MFFSTPIRYQLRNEKISLISISNLYSGITVCINCSGIHRALGVHISKVRSLTLDTWELETVSIMKRLGNSQMNKIYEYKLPANQKLEPNASSNERNEFIKSKYIDKKWVPTQEELKSDFEKIGLPDPGDMKLHEYLADCIRSKHFPGNWFYLETSFNNLHDMVHIVQMIWSISYGPYLRVKPLKGILCAIAIGCDVNNVLVNDQSPLDISIQEKSVLMTELLLINGADVNLRVPNLENGTAINRAIQLNHIGLVSLLIKRRALLNIKNNNDLGPIEMAQQCEDAHVLTTLR